MTNVEHNKKTEMLKKNHRSTILMHFFYFPKFVFFFNVMPVSLFFYEKHKRTEMNYFLVVTTRWMFPMIWIYKKRKTNERSWTNKKDPKSFWNNPFSPNFFEVSDFSKNIFFFEPFCLCFVIRGCLAQFYFFVFYCINMWVVWM